MDEDVICIESSDDEASPPKKITKMGEKSTVVSSVKGTTIIKTKTTPRQQTIPIFKLDFGLDEKGRNISENSTHNKNTVDLTEEISIVSIKAASSSKSFPLKSVSQSVLKSKSLPSTSVVKKPMPMNNQAPISILKVQAAAAPKKRITPIKLSNTVAMRKSSLEKSSDSDGGSQDNSNQPGNGLPPTPLTNDNELHDPEAKHRKVDDTPKTPLNDEFKSLIDACNVADNSEDMQRMVDRKLIKYYQSVHPNFVNSKTFRKTVSEVTRSVQAKPNLVYVTINSLVEEMKTRRIVVVDDRDPDPNESITGDQKKDLKIRKLSKALHKLKRRIAKLEEAEVDFEDEDNSKYMISEKCKKRAWVIYEKICDLTGESKDAQRLVKKPIRFHDSPFREFNRTLEAFVNKTNSFPDMFDVLRCLEHCNKQYSYRLSKEECRNHAKTAFIQVGRQLQKRRKSDLYEMVAYYTRDRKDPALEDQNLKIKLEENQKQHKKKMNEVFDRYAFDQDHSGTKDIALEPEAGPSNLPDVKEEVDNFNEPSNCFNRSALTTANKSLQPDIFDDDLIIPDETEMALLDVTKFEAPINLDDDMDFPMEITNVMSIDDFNFGASQVEKINDSL